MSNEIKTPAFIKPWQAPFHVTMEGIKDAKGCWVCSAANNKLAHELVEMMNTCALLIEQRENAAQAMSETHSDWESRCHAIMAALSYDFGGSST